MADKSGLEQWWGGPKPSLYPWIAGQMAKGAGYAALVFGGCILFVLVFRWIGQLLPDDPYAALTILGAFA